MPSLVRLQLPGVVVALRGEVEDGCGTSPKHVLLQFRVIAIAVRPRARQIPGQHSVAERKLLALSTIARSPGIRVIDLARVLGVRQPTASQMVKALAGLQLVEVDRDGCDRRAVRIRASAAGLSVLRSLPAHFEFEDRLLEALCRLEEPSLRSLEACMADLIRALGHLDFVETARGGAESCIAFDPDDPTER